MLSIREAGITDIPLIRELCFKIWPQTYASIISNKQIAYMLEMMYSEKSLYRQITDEGCRFIFVYENNEPVGFASFSEVEPTIYKLHKIYILPIQQGKGAGKFVLGYIMNTIKPEGATILLLQVNRRNNAKNFYEKLGFAVTLEFDFDIGNGYVMDDYMMEKKLI